MKLAFKIILGVVIAIALYFIIIFASFLLFFIDSVTDVSNDPRLADIMNKCFVTLRPYSDYSIPGDYPYLKAEFPFTIHSEYPYFWYNPPQEYREFFGLDSFFTDYPDRKSCIKAYNGETYQCDYFAEYYRNPSQYIKEHYPLSPGKEFKVVKILKYEHPEAGFDYYVYGSTTDPKTGEPVIGQFGGFTPNLDSDRTKDSLVDEKYLRYCDSK